jgi:hypothetical protein
MRQVIYHTTAHALASRRCDDPKPNVPNTQILPLIEAFIAMLAELPVLIDTLQMV